jgi:hypothetical protein
LQELPSLDLLQSFKAVVRHLSFTNAARELHITQSAVSHQIWALESYLGVSLFLRQNRRVLLSPEGQVLFPAVISAFQGLGEALEQVQESSEQQALTVAVEPQFGANWMAHRIGSFQRQLPEVTLHLHISHLEPTFHAGAGGPWGVLGARVAAEPASGAANDVGIHGPCAVPDYSIWGIRFVLRKTCNTTPCCTAMTTKTGGAGWSSRATRSCGIDGVP